MEWYVLGNGPWDYAAIHPDLARKSPAADFGGKGVFGTQYSGYPNKTDLSRVPTATQRSQDDDYNQIGNWEKSATRSLFMGQIDGQHFAPMRTDYGSTYASMVFRTADMRQVMFSWIYETAAGISGWALSCPDACLLSCLLGGHCTPVGAAPHKACEPPACQWHAHICTWGLSEFFAFSSAPANNSICTRHTSLLLSAEVTADIAATAVATALATAAGCSFMCSDELPDIIKRQGFKGVQTLPRQLTYVPLTKTLRAYPVNETSTLRGNQVSDPDIGCVAIMCSSSMCIAMHHW